MLMEQAATSPRPPLSFAGLPEIPALERLKSRDQWVAWRYVWKPEKQKWDKPPHTLRGGFASSTSPNSWSSFSAAQEFALREPETGVGYVLTTDDELTGIDIDGCRDSATGVVDEWVQAILGFNETYSEISPSGTGIRMFAHGKIDKSVASKQAGVELYGAGRYLTVTGNVIDGSVDEIRPAPLAIETLLARIDRFKREAQGSRTNLAPSSATGAVKQTFRAGGDDFFRNVNDRALRSLDSWFPSIFPGARYQSGTGGWRVAARELGRDLEEDLSATSGGIVDFGIHDMGDARDGKRTAIDIVIEHGGAPDVMAAARWLCDRLGVRAEDVGYRPSTSNVTPLFTGSTGAGSPTATQRALPTFLASELHGLPIPPRKWHVPDMIPTATVTIISADGGTGKSLIALQLATSTVLSSPWLGLKTASGRVLFLSAEDDRDEIHRRLADIVASIGVDLDDLGGLKIVPLAGEDAVLGAPSGRGGVIEPTPLWKAYEAEAMAWKPSLIINDTLADIFGGDEIQRAQARQFINMMRGLAIRTGAAVVLLAHPSISGMSSGSGTSGSTGWNNSVRSRLYLNRVFDEDGRTETDPDLRTLTTKKANYTRSGGEIKLRWEDGVFIPVDAPTVSGMDMLGAQARAERIFMELLDAYSAEGRKVSPSYSANYAPAVFAKDPRSSGTTKKAMNAAMNYLFQTKLIEVEEVGPPSKRRQYIVRAQAQESRN